MSNVKIKHQKQGEFIRKVWRDHYTVYLAPFWCLAPFGWYKYHFYHLIQGGLPKISLQWNAITLTLFRTGIFGAAYGWVKKAPLPKICYTHPTMMKLGSYNLPKEDPKNIWITWHTPWVLLTSAFFHRKSAHFVISRNTDIDWILIHNF